jgi:hypothetical protein
MTRPDNALCVFVAPHADDAKGPAAEQLRAAGMHLWVWSAAEQADSEVAAPGDVDALFVLEDDPTPSSGPSAQRLIDVLRRAWSHGATIGLFGGAAKLLDRADIATTATPVEAAGLFLDELAPTPGVIEEFLDAVRSGPHADR